MQAAQPFFIIIFFCDNIVVLINHEGCMKKQINLILNNVIVEKFLIILILFNVFVFIFETDKNFYAEFSTYIKSFELLSMIVFSVEYFLRVMSLEKIQQIFRPLMIVDFLAILPFYFSAIKINTICLRLLRLCRLLRIAKLVRYTNALLSIKNALVRKKDELTLTGISLVTCLIIFSILIYYAEHKLNYKAFSSIPSSFWWAIITFTSVGYGDTYPITTFGKIIASFAAILGLCFNGLFIGILGSAFMETIEERKMIKNNLTNRDEIIYEKISD